jgi:hypothetical protein
LLPEGFGGAASPFRVSSAGMNVTSGIFAWIDPFLRQVRIGGGGERESEMSNRKSDHEDAPNQVSEARRV